MRFLASAPLLVSFIHFLALVPRTDARQAVSEPRAIQSLSADHLSVLAKADPPDWEGVVEGHLGKLLVPRAGKLARAQSWRDTADSV
jgi:glutaminyl-peptide cyclotransferase